MVYTQTCIINIQAYVWWSWWQPTMKDFVKNN